MREIKFRAWDEERKKYCIDREWVEYYHYGDGLMKAKNYRRGPNQNQSQDLLIEQYTGLKDGNGQEVFEGDVIKMIALHNDHHQKGAVDYASIYFSHGQFCIALDGHKIGTPLFNVKLSSSVEVIGNIHENGDLLK